MTPQFTVEEENKRKLYWFKHYFIAHNYCVLLCDETRKKYVS